DLHEGAALRVPPALEHLAAQSLGLLAPAGDIACEPELGRNPGPTIEGDPGHHLAEHVVLRLVARLPDAPIRLLPVRRGPIHEVSDRLPQDRKSTRLNSSHR